MALAVSAGIKRADYAPSGRYHFTMEQILAPFELAFRYYFHADWREFFAFYGAEETPGVDYESSVTQIEKRRGGVRGIFKKFRHKGRR